MCPVCKEVFTSRSKLTEHKAKTQHQGGAVIYVEPPKEKTAIAIKTINKKNPHSCPRCDRTFKNKKALQNHQKDKKHFDIKTVKGKNEIIVQKKLPISTTEKVVLPPKNLGNGYVVIRNSDYEKMMESIEILKPFVNFETISFEMLPSTLSWLVSYKLSNETDWDYVLFYCDFVEIEHTLESFLSLESKLNLDDRPIVFDLASLDSREGISDNIYVDSEECLMITQKEDDKVSYGDMIVGLQQMVDSEENTLSVHDLLLVGGEWKRPVVKKTKAYTQPLYDYSSRTKPIYRNDYADDNYFGMNIYGAEEKIEDSSSEADEDVIKDKIETFNTNPVYLITNERLCIDKLVNVELPIK